MSTRELEERITNLVNSWAALESELLRIAGNNADVRKENRKLRSEVTNYESGARLGRPNKPANGELSTEDAAWAQDQLVGR